MARPNSYLLDTNALIALFRNNDLGKYIDQTYHLTSPSTASYVPVVVIGEIHSLALQWGWDATKVTALQTILSGFYVLEITNDGLVWFGRTLGLMQVLTQLAVRWARTISGLQRLPSSTI
jgi:predicted nucleic acid-binding protein